MSELPSGEVTFAFVDMEGSTALLRALGQERYREVLRAYETAVRTTTEANRGVVSGFEGDGAFCVFWAVDDAITCALAIRDALTRTTVGDGTAVRPRIGLHVGHAEPVDGEYIALEIHQAARVGAAANGGQVLLSDAAAAKVRHDAAKMVCLGEFVVRDFDAPVALWEATPAEGRARPPRVLPRTTPNNIGVPLDPLVGRGDDLAELADRIESARLMTLTGVGGVGKTRLAVELAHRVASRFGGGVWFVDLSVAPHTSASQDVASLVADAIGVEADPDKRIDIALAERLSHAETLVVLDNCEHVIEAVAVVAEQVLRTAATARMLCTSREPLQVAGEIIRPIHPLPTPDDGVDGLSWADNDSARLLVDRVVRSGRPLDMSQPAQCAAVGAICAAVEGIPLAIELAAAAVSALGVVEVAGRIERVLPLLTSGTRTAPGRHSTLHAAIQWSYDLLDDATRAAYRACSAFAGEFSLADAEVVVGPDAVRAVAALVRRSLLTSTEGRFRMLVPVREHATELRNATGEDATTLERHLQWVAGVVGGRKFDAVARIRNDLRAALTWGLDGGAPEEAAAVALAADGFWDRSGAFREASQWLSRALEVCPDLPHDMATDMRLRAAFSSHISGDRAMAERLASETVGRCRAVGDRVNLARALSALARSVEFVDPASARELLTEGLDAARGAGEQRLEAIILGDLAAAAEIDGDYHEAWRIHAEALEVAKAVGGDTSGALCSLISLDLAFGNADSAHRRATMLLSDARDQQYDRVEIYALDLLIDIAIHCGDVEGARAWLSELAAVAAKNPDEHALIVHSGSAKVALASGEVDVAHEHAATLIEFASGDSYLHAAAALLLGEVAIRRNDCARARALLVTAAQQWEESASWRERLPAADLLVLALAKEGRRSEAERLLAAADHDWTRLGLSRRPAAQRERDLVAAELEVATDTEAHREAEAISTILREIGRE